MFYDVVDLSKYIVTKCVEDKCPISNLHLQKILWFIQKDFILHNKCAFVDSIEAWGFGPCVPKAYYTFFGYGANRIVSKYEYGELNPEDKELIDSIVEKKSKLMPWEMVDETNRKGGAWDLIYRNGHGNEQLIPFELIKKLGIKA